jgi:hypothetical protein
VATLFLKLRSEKVALRAASQMPLASLVCERWLYTTCLVFGLDIEEQQCSGFRHQYSIYQLEYSHNLQFQAGKQREEVFQALINRSRSLLNLNRAKTIFGAKNRPQHRRRDRNPARWGVVVETPRYDVTVFKVHYGKLTLKIYTKGERVLRIEVIVHNTKELRRRTCAGILSENRHTAAGRSGEISQLLVVV